VKKTNIEYVVTAHCKICGEVVSLGIPLSFEEATDAVARFKEEHQHQNPGPWVI